MEKAKAMANEIKTLQRAVIKTASPKLRADYNKAIKRKKQLLGNYCRTNKLNYTEVVNGC